MCIGVAPPNKAPWPHPLIAREGWPFLAGAFVLALLATLYSGPVTTALGWIVCLFVLQFFRDPARPAPAGEGLVLSPADGRIVAVEETDDPWLNRRALKISVFMNVFNVHSNRAPVDGEVKGCWYNPGKFINADLAKASTENERNAVWFRTRAGQDVTSVQVAGLIARRILCYAKDGDPFNRGQRYGFIRFGSRVDVYLPTTAQPRVTLGDKVKASADILAQL
ncbi:MAG: phosphatidylserine decarboxylase [Betaproteobacteria bacterium]|nr:phosphatidylserine decarboxylase [Betaproteobacteria bacterium]